MRTKKIVMQRFNESPDWVDYFDKDEVKIYQTGVDFPDVPC